MSYLLISNNIGRCESLSSYIITLRKCTLYLTRSPTFHIFYSSTLISMLLWGFLVSFLWFLHGGVSSFGRTWWISLHVITIWCPCSICVLSQQDPAWVIGFSSGHLIFFVHFIGIIMVPLIGMLPPHILEVLHIIYLFLYTIYILVLIWFEHSCPTHKRFNTRLERCS